MLQDVERSVQGGKFAHVKLDYHTEKLFVSFMKKKSQVAEDGLRFIEDLASGGKRLPKYIRMDRSGENKVMMQMIKKKYPRIKFELTAKGTLQQNRLGLLHIHLQTEENMPPIHLL